MERSIEFQFPIGEDDDKTAVEVDSTSVTVRDFEGKYVVLDFDQWDQIVAEVDRARRIMRECAEPAKPDSTEIKPGRGFPFPPVIGDARKEIDEGDADNMRRAGQ